MKNIVIKLSYILLLSALLFSCTDTSITPNTTNYSKVAEAVSSGSSFDVEMLSVDSLFVGYDKVFFKVTEKSTNKSINQAVLVMHPLMDMGTTKHACPWENPSSNKNADGLYEGAILFSMAGINSWSVSMDVTANGITETVKFDIPKVIATNPVQKLVVIDSVTTSGTLVQTKYPISIVTPKAWKVGMNPFEITIHCMQDMMTYSACSDFTVEITPEMPSMGHGSPNNVNPVYVSNGHYVGSVNFTMTGAWRINLLIKKSNWIAAKKAYFDITF
jgi:hypothetical protein